MTVVTGEEIVSTVIFTPVIHQSICCCGGSQMVGEVHPQVWASVKNTSPHDLRVR